MRWRFVNPACFSSLQYTAKYRIETELKKKKSVLHGILRLKHSS